MRLGAPLFSAPRRTRIVLVLAFSVSSAGADDGDAGGDSSRFSGRLAPVPVAMYDPDTISLWAECDRTVPPSLPYGAAAWFVTRVQRHRWRVPLRSGGGGVGAGAAAAAARADGSGPKSPSRDPVRWHGGENGSLGQPPEVVVIPALLDWAARGRCGKRSLDDHLRNLTETIAAAAKRDPGLAAVPHVVFAQDWYTQTPPRRVAQRAQAALRSAGLATVLFATHLHRWRNRNWMSLGPEQCRFGVGFMSNYDGWPEALSADSPWEGKPDPPGVPRPDVTARRPYLVEFMGQVHNNPERMRLLRSPPERRFPDGTAIIFTPTKPEVSGVRPCARPSSPGVDARAETLRYCQAKVSAQDAMRLRALAEMSIFLHGDDEGSDRLINAVSTLTLPLLVGNDSAWLPFHTLVRWRHMVIAVNAAAFARDPVAAVVAAAPEPSVAEAMRRATVAHWPDLLWGVPGSRVHENVLREAKRLAEGCAAATKR